MVNDGQPMEFSKLIGPYCFGDLSDEQRLAMEVHLLTCDECWSEVQRLELAVRSLRADVDASQNLISRETVGLFGLSSRLDRTLGGHESHVIRASGMYSFLFAISLVFEVAYEYDRFGNSAVLTALLVILPLVWVGSLFTAAREVRQARMGRPDGPVRSILAYGTLAIATWVCGFWLLPHEPVTKFISGSPGYPAPLAFIKDGLYYLPFAIVYFVVPLSTILGLQVQLRDGRYHVVLDLLRGGQNSVAPRGVLLIPVWLLGVLLALVGLGSIYLTTNLFDHIAHQRYRTLFMLLVQLRTLLFFALGAESLIWYRQTLDEIKRECLLAIQTGI